ncbi:hypothetical protein [Enterococcus lactis]
MKWITLKTNPQAIIYGGVLIAFFYLFAAFGMGAAVPADQLSASGGLIDSFILLVGGLNPCCINRYSLHVYAGSKLISLVLRSKLCQFCMLRKNHDMPLIFAKKVKRMICQ